MQELANYLNEIYEIRDIIPLSLGMFTLHKSCNMLKFNFCGKKHAVPNVLKNRRPHHTKMHISIPGTIVIFPRHNGKYNICIYNQEIQVLKSDFLYYHQILF